MKKNKLLVLVGLAVASFVMLTGFRHAGGPGPHGGPGGFLMGRGLEHMLDEIDATDAQRAQIEAIKERLVAAQQARADERQEGPRALVEFWKQENPDAAQVHAKIDEKFEAHRAAAYQMADAMIEVHHILTPEQRAEVAQLVEKRMARHEKRFAKRQQQKFEKQQPAAK